MPQVDVSKVDVIVPCYKYGHFLRECVQSVLIQEGIDLRVLVIDDASPDDTSMVASELAAADKRVEVRRHPVNWGHIATYNEGLEWSRGDYTVLLGADDVLTRGALARAARLLNTHPEVALVYGRGIETRDPRSIAPMLPAVDSWQVVDGEKWIEACCRIGGNPVTTPTAVVRTSVLARIGGYRSDLPHAADMELWLRLAVCGPVGILEAEQAYYRRHGSNMSLSYAGLGDLRERKAVFNIFFAEQGHRLLESRRLRELALRRLAQEACRQATVAFFSGNARLCRQLLALAFEVRPPKRCAPAWRRFHWLWLIDPLCHIWLRAIKRYTKSALHWPKQSRFGSKAGSAQRQSPLNSKAAQ